MTAMASSGPAESPGRPLDLQAREPRPARIGTRHDEDGRGTRGRRQPADLEALSPRAEDGGVKGSERSRQTRSLSWFFELTRTTGVHLVRSSRFRLRRIS